MGAASGATRPLLIYTLGRLALFGICAAVFYLCGMGLLLALLVAALVSSVAAYFLLTKQRDELGLAVEHRVTEARARAAERVAREDAIADEMIAEQERERAQPHD